LTIKPFLNYHPVMSLKLRIYLVIICVIFLSSRICGQSFSFNCTRDTSLPGCPANFCFTLQGVIPDIKGLSTSYSLNPTSTIPGCFPVYVQPNDPLGTSTNLSVDDTYSSVINMSFNFSFFGAIYNQLVASTNGYVSFDISLAGGSSHWQDRGDLPNTQYDPALIMGPYHDLFPGQPTSPTQRIQYQELGTAPHRRWVLSFYKVPLFSCTSLIENTHQIILYESTGIIEVAIFDKQICTNWQQGKAMVGIQDFTRTNGMTAPQRRMSDPAWGSIGMNESWRFVPNSGPSLFRRVELYDISNNLIMTGTTVPLGNGQLQASFPNLCPPAGTTTIYIIKSVYTKIDDPNVEIFGTDTVRVNRANGLTATGTSTPATCNQSNGSITVNNVTGGTPPYQYSLDNVNWQSSNTFINLAPGNYTVYVRDAPLACNTNFTITVGNTGAITATHTTTQTACIGVNNGTITITSASGTGPYTFSLDGGPPLSGSIPFTFSNVSAGAHTVVVTEVSTGCNFTLNVTVGTGPGVSGTATSTATSCPSANNGTITVDATAGTSPFTYQLNGGPPQSGSNPYIFNNVPAGTHTVVITDNVGCTLTISNIIVTAGPTLSASTSSTPTSCNGASNGTITVTPTSGTAPYTFSLDGGPAQTGPAPFTFTNVSAGSHTIVVTDAVNCVSNPITEIVAAGPNLSTTATSSGVLCNGGSTGSITVVQPTMGNPPYEYSLDNVNWQGSNVFNGLTAGTYTVYFREVNGCQGSLSITVNQPAALAASSITTPVVCNGQSNGVINVSASGGVSPYQYSIDGGASWQSSGTFNVVAGNYTITIRDANNCTSTTTANVTEPAALTANHTSTNASCDGGNDGTITVTTNGGNGSYQYSLDGISFQASNLFNVAPGNYTVTVRDNMGCTYAFPATVDMTSNLALTPQTDPTICEGGSVQLNVNSNATGYSWSPGTDLSSTTIPNPVANPATTTQYVVTVTLGRCTANDTVVVNVSPAPVPDAGMPGTICYGQSFQLQGSGGTQFTWSPVNYINNANIPNPTVNPPVTITYILSVRDGFGCPSLITDSVTVTVTPPIKVRTFPFDTIAYTGDQIQLNAFSAIPDSTYIYSWSPSFGLSDPTIPNPIVTAGPIGTDMTYRISISTPAGCRGDGFVRVRVYQGPDIYVPTAFTPNGDGKNDKLTPFPVGVKKLNYFRVFNRWGQLIFTTTSLHDGWDGRIGGKEQATGVYVWMTEGITKDDQVIRKRGTVTLIR